MSSGGGIVTVPGYVSGVHFGDTLPFLTIFTRVSLKQDHLFLPREGYG